MTQIKHLKTYPSMQEALLATDTLYAAYLKTNKRKATIDLTVASMGSVGRGPSETEVRIWYEKDQEAEANWFVEAVK